MLVVRVKFLADDPILVKAARNAKLVRLFYGAAMRAGGFGRKESLPAGTAVALFRMAYTLLGNWHECLHLIQKLGGHK
jgi:hypothetical protein